MISQSQNRVQAIKSKFENLKSEPTKTQLSKYENNACEERIQNCGKENKDSNTEIACESSDEWSPSSPNPSYLYSKGAVKRTVSETKKTLTRNTSDPGKKLHRSHAFRCDRSQKIVSPKRVGSCYGRFGSETGDFTLKMGEKRLSKDKLKRLGNLLEDQMKKEGFVAKSEQNNVDVTTHDAVEENMEPHGILETEKIVPMPVDSIPDSAVPQHILDQYAKVIKPRKNEEILQKQDGMTDSGVSSETENVEEEKTSKVKQLRSQFEKNDSTDSEKSNLESMLDICASSDTIKLEKKNPHVKITDTLKKALKQPLPAGPPPKKPPRTFAAIPETPEKHKKDTKKMLEKLEQVLQKREAQNLVKNEYDIAETNLSLKNDANLSGEKKEFSLLKKPKEIHYLCTEILDISNRTLLPSQNSLNNCFKSLNCAVPTANSTLSLPYTRLSTGRIAEQFCSCSSENLHKKRLSTFSSDYCSKCMNDTSNRFSTFLNEKCSKCQFNDEKHGFKCHLSCKCKTEANFFLEKDPEHIYDVPFIGSDDSATLRSKKTNYGTLNHSKSLEDLRLGWKDEDQKIYDIPCEISRPATPEAPEEEFAGSNPSIPKNTEQFPKINEARATVQSSKLSEDQETSDFSSPKFIETSPKIVEAIPKSPEKRLKSREQIPRLEFQKLRQSFECGFQNTDDQPKIENGVQKIDIRISNEADSKNVTDTTKLQRKCIENQNNKLDKPPMKPKPLFIKNKMSKSSENLYEELKGVKKENKRISTNGRKYRKERDASAARNSVSKRDSTQLDVDRENLNRLMTEIYATVTAVTDMDNKPGSFPTDGEDGNTSEDSVKLTRSLTEKRKNYVRRVSSKVAYLDQKNLRTRYRHQTSVCSYKSEIIDNPYHTFRSWKSFRSSQKNINKMADRRSTDSKINLTDSSGNILSNDDIDSLNSEIDKGFEMTGCVDIGLPFEPRERGLFNVCLLVGLNHMTGQAYVKSVFPSQVQVPPHIENLIFPETLSAASKGLWSAEAKRAQCYSLVLTDERGERSYGYCRRVLPEGATTCLPLCYCLIGKYRAPGFYYKVLQEIESHHGSSEVEIHSILQQLFEIDFPGPGEEISITYTSTNELNRTYNTYNFDLRKSFDLGDMSKCKTLPDLRRSLGKSGLSPKSNEKVECKVKSEDSENKASQSELADKSHDIVKQSGLMNESHDKVISLSEVMESGSECDSLVRSESASGLQFGFDNNNGTRKVLLALDRVRTKTMKRPIEPRIDESNMSTLLDSIGAGLTIKIFGSLLLERKVLVVGDHLSQVSSCMEALQSALYPFVWQQPLISTIPAEIQKDVLEAPLPILAGMLKTGGDIDLTGVTFEEGMLIDLNHPSKVLFYQGDESTILPTSSYKTLKTTLQMESKKHDDDQMRNVMISEAFMRFFVDILGDFWRFFFKGDLKEGMLGKGGVIFDKENFIKSTSSKQNQYFLEWFTETAMFNHFIQNMALSYNHNVSEDSLNCMELVDTPLPDFYDLFQERVNSRKSAKKSSGIEKNNYKFAVNKRVKLLKTKLRELVT